MVVHMEMRSPSPDVEQQDQESQAGNRNEKEEAEDGMAAAVTTMPLGGPILLDVRRLRRLEISRYGSEGEKKRGFGSS